MGIVEASTRRCSPVDGRSWTRTRRERALELSPPTTSTSSVRGGPFSFSLFDTSSRIRVVSLPSSRSTLTVMTTPSSLMASSWTTPSATLHSRPLAELDRLPPAGGADVGGGGAGVAGGMVDGWASCKRGWWRMVQFGKRHCLAWPQSLVEWRARRQLKQSR